MEIPYKYILILATTLMFLSTINALPKPFSVATAPLITITVLLTLGTWLRKLTPSSSKALMMLFGIFTIVVIFSTLILLSNIFYIPIDLRYVISLAYGLTVLINWKIIKNEKITIDVSTIYLVPIGLMPALFYHIITYGITFGLNFDAPISIIQPLLRIYYDNYYSFAVRLGELSFYTGLLFTNNLSAMDIYVYILSLKIVLIGWMTYLFINFMKNNISIYYAVILLLVLTFSFQGCLSPTACLYADTVYHSFKSSTIQFLLFILLFFEIIKYISDRKNELPTINLFIVSLFTILAIIYLVRIAPVDYMLGYPTAGLLYFHPFIYISTFISLFFVKNKPNYFLVLLIFFTFLTIHAEESIFYLITIFSLLILPSLKINHNLFITVSLLVVFLILLANFFGLFKVSLWYDGMAFPVTVERILSFQSMDPFSFGLLFVVNIFIINKYYKLISANPIYYYVFLVFFILFILYLVPIAGSYRLFKFFPLALSFGLMLCWRFRVCPNWSLILVLILIIGIFYMFIMRVLYTNPIYFFKPYTQQLLSPDELRLIETYKDFRHSLFISDWFSEYALVANLHGSVLAYGRVMTGLELERYDSPRNRDTSYQILKSLVNNNFKSVNLTNYQIISLINNLPFQERKYVEYLCANGKDVYVSVLVTPRVLRAVEHYIKIGYNGFVWDIAGDFYKKYREFLINNFNSSIVILYSNYNICKYLRS